jgi:hypothetical protein
MEKEVFQKNTEEFDKKRKVEQIKTKYLYLHRLK